MAQDAPKGTKLEFEISGKLKGTGVVAAQKGTTVVVENLFNNLPVRRRELERNIKREWGRVISVLGQYACIQTGIKFSVTQQPTKGKKTSLFSTKGNQSTRENIVNVFGAKTLTALVPLDLKLDLEPTSGPSQRRSTEEDGGKKDIRIVGHISRPASGEGRQTPDRQMFFVNARPCGLPQVSKAFNEVYKSYNASQSPFIFANIELDTHLYDVNVSPDKRTILLHDQTRMLENLKTALTALFESQDYTVPISQLPSQKQPSFKQLTISRESTARAQTPQKPKNPQTLAESTDGEASEEEGFTRPSREQSMNEERSTESSNTGLKRSVVPRDSLSRDSQAVSLISNWIGRRAEDRADQKPQPSEAAIDASGSLSKDKRALVEKLRREGRQPQIAPDSLENLTISPPTIQSSSLASYNRSLPIPEQAADSQSQSDEEEESMLEMREPAIPALHTPSKSSSAVSNTFSSSKRPLRVPLEVATITIGDHTVTTSIGTPPSKKPRIENSATVSHNAGRSETPDVPIPSFGSRLSQRFAAPGTQPLTPNVEDTEPETLDENDSPQPLESVGSEEEAVEPASSQTFVKEEADASSANQNIDEEKYINEAEKKAQEEAKVQEMIKAAEESSAQSSQENALRAKALLKGSSKKRDATLHLVRVLDTNVSKIGKQIRLLDDALSSYRQSSSAAPEDEALDSDTAEEKLSLTISKTDFARMKIIGQFNLGFILASRASEPGLGVTSSTGDELFIIDQHSSDEKYNFERLQATTIVQSQRLVYPKTLDLTAMEEEIVIENLPALETNGFLVTVDETGEVPVGQRCQLISLPLSRETAFSITDLEELLVLLAENPPGSVPRPSKVRKMFAMRACRSSIMIGRTLTRKQMGNVVKHLGELDKPWNCPHGRPTMRHLCGLGFWDASGWREGNSLEGEKPDGTDWAAYVRQSRGDSSGSTSP